MNKPILEKKKIKAFLLFSNEKYIIVIFFFHFREFIIFAWIAGIAVSIFLTSVCVIIHVKRNKMYASLILLT